MLHRKIYHLALAAMMALPASVGFAEETPKVVRIAAVVYNIAGKTTYLNGAAVLTEGRLEETLAKKGVKIIVAGQWESGLYFTKSIIEEKAEELGLIYGEDWVNIGFKAGGTATWRLMKTKFWEGAMGRDINDVPFEDLPLMHRVQRLDADTFAAIICFTSGSPGDGTWITYFPEIPLLTGQVAVQVASRMRYLQTGQMKGLLAGMRGAAEYEQLIGHLDVATKLMDAQTLAHLLVIFFIVLGNIGYVAGRRRNA